MAAAAARGALEDRSVNLKCPVFFFFFRYQVPSPRARSGSRSTRVFKQENEAEGARQKAVKRSGAEKTVSGFDERADEGRKR